MEMRRTVSKMSRDFAYNEIKKLFIFYHHTEFELTVELLPVPAVPANRVEANGAFSTGRLQASSDHGALSYILD